MRNTAAHAYNFYSGGLLLLLFFLACQVIKNPITNSSKSNSTTNSLMLAKLDL